MIRIEDTEDAFISCQLGLDHPSSKLHKSRSACDAAD